MDQTHGSSIHDGLKRQALSLDVAIASLVAKNLLPLSVLDQVTSTPITEELFNNKSQPTDTVMPAKTVNTGGVVDVKKDKQ